MKRMNATEKLGQLVTGNNAMGAAIPSLGIPEFNYASEALHGVWSGCVQVSTAACERLFYLGCVHVPNTDVAVQDPASEGNCSCVADGAMCLLGVANSDTRNCKCPTQFPAPISLGASFDADLWREVGAAMASEGRGLFKGGGAKSMEGPLGLVFYGPNVRDDCLNSIALPSR